MIYTRQNIWNLAPNDSIVRAYADAVNTMWSRPINDPTGWFYQAAIHGTQLTNPLSTWNQCRHGSWYFISWHRMYVYFFEAIVRRVIIEQGGPSDWALPYWDYNNPGQNSLPLAFRKEKLDNGLSNPLYVQERARGINAGATLPPQITSPEFALGKTLFTGPSEFGGGKTDPGRHFWAATGRLEQTPHNDIHNAVGGSFGWMSDPATAAQDPIFWLHHSNIDRIWWIWQNMPHRTNPTDPAWSRQAFSFMDVNGNPISIAAIQIQDIVNQLGYDYSPSPDSLSVGGSHPPTLPPPLQRAKHDWPDPWPAFNISRLDTMVMEETMPELLGATSQSLLLDEDNLNVTLQMDKKAVSHVVNLIGLRQLNQKIFLDLEDLSAEENPGSVYAVYLNLPDNTDEQSKLEYHIGNVSLFGIRNFRDTNETHLEHSLRLSFEITDFLDQQGKDNTWQNGESIDITFEKQYLGQPDDFSEDEEMSDESSGIDSTPIKIGRISIRCE